MGTNKIDFKKMEIQNFLSVGEKITFNFMDHKGMSYIYGVNPELGVKNGVGKSAIFVDAIIFALFGETGRNITNAQIPNRKSKKNCIVRLWFSKNDKHYLVEHGLNPSVYNLYEVEETTGEILLNEKGEQKSLSKSSKTLTLEYVRDEILHSNSDLYRLAVIMSGNGSTNLFNMKEAQRREFVDYVFQYSLIGTIYDMVKQDMNELDKKLTIEKSNFIRLSTDAVDFRKRENCFEEERSRKIESTTKEIKELIGEIKAIDLQVSATSTEEDKESIRKNIQELDVKIVELTDKKHQLEVMKTGLRGKISGYGEKIEKYSELLEMLCVHCHPTVDKKLNITEEGRLKIESEGKLEKINEAIKKILAMIVTEQTTISILKSKLDEATRNGKKQDSLKLDRERKMILANEKKGKLSEIKNEVSQWKELAERKESEQSTSKEKIDSMVEEKKYYEFLKHMYSKEGIKKELIATLINTFNKRLSEYLEQLRCEYAVIFDQEFIPTFVTTEGICSYDSFSAGEKRRLDMAAVFSLRDLVFGQGSIRSNILVVDECLDSALDSVGLSAIIDVLRKESETQSVFVISHREYNDIDLQFDNVIRLEKLGGNTIITNDTCYELKENNS